MRYRLDPGRPLPAEVRRVAREQLQAAQQELEGGDDPREHIHEARKRLKKVRGLLRLVRPAMEDVYDRENARLREAAGRLSDLRDAAARVEAYDELIDGFEHTVDQDSVAPVRRALLEARDEAEGSPDRVAELRDASAADVQAAVAAVDGWEPPETFAPLADGAAKTYRRARKAWSSLDDGVDAELLHELRKRMKYHWLHIRLLQDLWPEPMKARREAVKALADDLGDDRDLILLSAHLRESPRLDPRDEPVELTIGLAAAGRRRFRRRIAPRAARVLADDHDALAARWTRWWEAAVHPPTLA